MPVDDEAQAKRVGSSMELKQVQTHDDAVEPDPKFDPPNFEDDEDLEDMIAAAHHRFEDDSETISLLSTSPSSLGGADQDMALSPQMRVSRYFFFSSPTHLCDPIRNARLLESSDMCSSG
jgi:hypothetical protein